MSKIQFSEYEIDILKNLVIDEIKETYEAQEEENQKRGIVNATYWYKIDLDKIKEKIYHIKEEDEIELEPYEELPFN